MCSGCVEGVGRVGESNKRGREGEREREREERERRGGVREGGEPR